MSEQVIYIIEPITINGIKISRVVIDMHYKEKHADHMNDDLILRLVKRLDGRKELPEAKINQYSYFVTRIELDDKQYRLIWLFEDHVVYIGVVNAYREKRKR